MELVKMEAIKGNGPSFSCGYCDTDLVHKIAQVLLPGLASVCVDSITGDFFKSPASVAVDIRKEMVDYLVKKSETFNAESVVEGGNEEMEVLNNLVEIVSDFIEEFASLKRSIFSQVSGWLLTERREDKIDEFEQSMEIDGFWPMDRRKAVAHVLLKNLDYKNLHHCGMKFDTLEEREQHGAHCNLRVLSCPNEGCRSKFSAIHLEKHKSTCPFKVLPCEQKCFDNIMRCDMDKHCITVCPMKLTNCPFYQLGCKLSFPRCSIDEHCLEFLQIHLIFILHIMHTDETQEDLRKRVDLMKELPSFCDLSEARDVRSLTWKVKDLETEMRTSESNLGKESQSIS